MEYPKGAPQTCSCGGKLFVRSMTYSFPSEYELECSSCSKVVSWTGTEKIRLLTEEEARAKRPGFYPPKEPTECWTTFIGEGGYPGEAEAANKVFEKGKKYKVVGGEIGQAVTHIRLEGYDGSWNSVLFDVDISTAPLESLYHPAPVKIPKRS